MNAQEHPNPSPSEANTTWEGWYALHDFRRIDWTTWHALSYSERVVAQQRLHQHMSHFANVTHTGSSATFAIVGHKADVLFLHLRPSLAALREAAQTISASIPLLQQTTSYVSIVEVSNYMYRSEADPTTIPEVRERLYPSLPHHQHVCFYPMSKRRQGTDNWYQLPMDTRRQLMRQHGMIGRSYAGKVKQMITGSVGLDDWEWGVTLFSEDPIWFKKIVYDMRFDEVSAKYGEFGTFIVGFPAVAQTLLPV